MYVLVLLSAFGITKLKQSRSLVNEKFYICLVNFYFHIFSIYLSICLSSKCKQLCLCNRKYIMYAMMDEMSMQIHVHLFTVVMANVISRSTSAFTDFQTGWPTQTNATYIPLFQLIYLRFVKISIIQI